MATASIDYMNARAAAKRCSDCGWNLPRFDCPHQGCNGVALHTVPGNVTECPVCAARRAVTRARVARHRARKAQEAIADTF